MTVRHILEKCNNFAEKKGNVTFGKRNVVELVKIPPHTHFIIFKECEFYKI